VVVGEEVTDGVAESRGCGLCDGRWCVPLQPAFGMIHTAHMKHELQRDSFPKRVVWENMNRLSNKDLEAKFQRAPDGLYSSKHILCTFSQADTSSSPILYCRN
jgi:hypothetical protein